MKAGGELANLNKIFAKAYFEKAFFLKGSTVQHQVCSFKMLQNYEWDPFS